jgi:cytochrome c biogenesis protein CcdA
LAVFLAGVLAFLAPRWLVLACFFNAAAFAGRARDDLRAFFALRFFTVRFLAVATTISFIAQNATVGNDRRRSRLPRSF